MDHHSAMQGGGGAGAGAAAQEWFYAGGGQQHQPDQQAVVVVDGAFLMELLEDAPVADDQAAPEDVDRLSRVIRSLEAEIGGGGGPPPSAPADGRISTAAQVQAGDGVGSEGLEEYMLLDLDSSIPGPCVAEAPFEYWAEAPPAVEHDMGGWYVDGDGVSVMVGYEFREPCYYGGYSESPHVEHVYSPLWE